MMCGSALIFCLVVTVRFFNTNLMVTAKQKSITETQIINKEKRKKHNIKNYITRLETKIHRMRNRGNAGEPENE